VTVVPPSPKLALNGSGIEFDLSYYGSQSVVMVIGQRSLAGWYLTGGWGDVSWSLDFGIPLTGTDLNVPGWDTFDPPH